MRIKIKESVITILDKLLKKDKVTIKNNKNDFWKKWWNSFEKTDLQRVQGNQKRNIMFLK